MSIEALEKMGWSLEVLEGPSPSTRDNWPSIQYKLRLSFKGREVITTNYFLGIGHVKIKGSRPPFALSHLRTPWELMAKGKQLKDKSKMAEVAAYAAKKQKVKPKLDDVIDSLFLDGEAYFSGLTFENWAVQLGYSPDSRKAEKIFRECDNTGRKLLTVPSEALEKTREILENH